MKLLTAIFFMLAFAPYAPSQVNLSAASCFDDASGKLIGKSSNRTFVLASDDGKYRAYAETAAVPRKITKANGNEYVECRNTSTLFVAGANAHSSFKNILTISPSAELLGNSIEIIDWSANGHRLLIAENLWQYGSDFGETVIQIYDADAGHLFSKSFVEKAFRKHADKDCVSIFQPLGFSSNGGVIVTASPYFDVGDEQPRSDSCVQEKGIWIVGLEGTSVSKFPSESTVLHNGNIISEQCTETGPSSLKRRVAEADQNKYHSVTDASEWKNPFLSVGANRIDIQLHAGVRRHLAMSPSGAMRYLENLPAAEWPYGLVVAVGENGVRNPDDDASIKRNVAELVCLLERKGITVSLWPSA